VHEIPESNPVVSNRVFVTKIHYNSVAAPEFCGCRVIRIYTVKLLEFGQWLCRIQSAGLISAASFGVQYATAAFTMRQAHRNSCSTMTQHYPTTSAAAAVCMTRPSFPVSAMLLIYTTFSLLPARALSKTLLFALCSLRTRDKERFMKVLDDSATCSRQD